MDYEGSRGCVTPYGVTLLLRTLDLLDLFVEHCERHGAYHKLAVHAVTRALSHHERGRAIGAHAHGFGDIGLHPLLVLIAVDAVLELLRVELQVAGEAHDVAHIELVGVRAHDVADLPEFSLLPGAAGCLRGA